MKIATFAKLAAAALLPLGLAACGGGGSSSGTTPPAAGGGTTPTTTAFQDKAGTAFATVFNASATADPKKPAASDVPALSLTTDPFDN
jgi:hypothetical protein